MEKYVVVDWRNGESFEDSFDTKEEALKIGERWWGLLTEGEKKSRDFFAVMCGEVDEDGCLIFDTATVIKSYK